MKILLLVETAGNRRLREGRTQKLACIKILGERYGNYKITDYQCLILVVLIALTEFKLLIS